MNRLVFLTVFLAASKGFQLQGPKDPTHAEVGGSVLLPCSVEHPIPLEKLEVEWKRTDSDVLVHLFQDGEVRPESQDYAYTGRAHLFLEEVIRGNYSLVLNNVTREDTGVYICKVYSNLESKNITAEVYFERFLVTGASVVSGYAVEEVVLNCSVDSHVPPEKLEEVTWKRADNDILVLLYQDGEVLPDSSHEQYRGRAEFFTSEIPKGNFSLRLKDIRTEDIGAYICKAYSGDLSANTTVILQGLGFSDLHRFILVLCSISVLCNLVLIVPAGICLQRKDTSRRAQAIHFSLILCPNILLGLSFILWGVVEGFLGEAAACSTVNLIRFFLLIKTAPYLDTLSGCCQSLKIWGVVAEHSIVSLVVYSAFLWNPLERLSTNSETVLMAIFSISLLILRLFVIAGSAACSWVAGNTIRRWVAAFSLHVLSFIEISFIMLALATIRHDVLITLAAVFFGLCFLASLKCCCPTTSFARTLWATPLAMCIVLNNILYIVVTGQILESHKERAGFLAVRVLQQSLWSLTFFDPHKELPEIPQAVVYSVGASGLSLVNSITLMTELVLKAETGQRNVADLRVIVLPAESVFICCWMLLELYSAWMRNKHRFRRNPNQGPPRSRIAQEMQALSQTQNGATQ